MNGLFPFDAPVCFFSQIKDMAKGSLYTDFEENQNRLSIGSKFSIRALWALMGPIEIFMYIFCLENGALSEYVVIVGDVAKLLRWERFFRQN